MSSDALAALPLPLRALGIEVESDACTYAEQSNPALGERLIVPLVPERDFLAQYALLDLGGLVINSGRISPMISRQEPNHNAVLLLNYGGRCIYRHGGKKHESHRGDVILTTNEGGAYHCHYGSGIYLAIDTARLQQTSKDLLDNSQSQTISALIPLKQCDPSRCSASLPMLMSCCSRSAGFPEPLDWEASCIAIWPLR